MENRTRAEQPPVEESEPVFAYEWRYSTIETGGEKWQLLRKTDDPRAFSERIVATMIRLPGSLTRIFRALGDGEQSDHSAPCEARLVLIDELDVELPRLPGRSDEAHSRAIEMRRLFENRIAERRQRDADDERAIAENDEQRDYAEERFNEQLMREE